MKLHTLIEGIKEKFISLYFFLNNVIPPYPTIAFMKSILYDSKGGNGYAFKKYLSTIKITFDVFLSLYCLCSCVFCMWYLLLDSNLNFAVKGNLKRLELLHLLIFSNKVQSLITDGRKED